MKTFIKVIEIWTPDANREKLHLTDSYYGEYTDFNKHSQDIAFAFDEGLPGAAWANARPIVITDLEHSCFLRKQAARTSGITCAICLPIFSGQYLLAVMVLLCGDEDDLVGAIEVWGKNPQRPRELHLVDGYYGKMEKFEWLSRRLSFQKGNGLPGTIWDYHIPQICADLPTSSTFLRASHAQREGITTGIGIPFIYDNKHEYILTLLSARGTPIARRFEIWLPDREHRFLSLYSGHTEIPYDVFSYQEIEKGQGLIGQVWLSGCPAISHNPARDNFIAGKASHNDLSVSVAVPVLEEGVLTAVVAFTI